MGRNRFYWQFLAISGLVFLTREWGIRRGATQEELNHRLPGDELIPRPDLAMTNAITVRKPAEAVWPWIVQLGYYRGGWFTDSSWRDWDYLPDIVLRYFVREESRQSGVGHREDRTAERILDEYQNLKVGDVILDGPPGTAFFKVAAIDPGRALILHSNSHLRFLFPKLIRENPKLGIGGEFTWGFVLHKTGDQDTRVLLRTRGVIQPWWYRVFISTLVPVANFFLVQKMLGGIKRATEQAS